MRRFIPAIILALAGCATPEKRELAASATFNVTSSAGSSLGTVELIPVADGYRLSGRLRGLPIAGVLGMHLHTKGICEAPSFATAGGHLNPLMHQHGTLNPEGPHLGDLPNVAVDSSGGATIDVALQGDRMALDRALFDTDGTALMVHASADDYRTDPSGNSGSRMACGVLTHL